VKTGEENVGMPTQTKPGTVAAPPAQPDGAMAEYRVLLPVDIAGKIYQYDAVVALDAATAKTYAHALVRVEDLPKAAAKEQATTEVK